MGHPQRFDESDPHLEELRKICLGFPGADEKVSHGRPAFFTKKIFAMFGAVTKGDHDSGDHAAALVFLPADDELLALEQDDRFFVPAYWGPYGWRAIDLDADGVDWHEIAELVEDSFRQTASKTLVKQLDDASA